jgi:hypothetical protein
MSGSDGGGHPLLSACRALSSPASVTRMFRCSGVPVLKCGCVEGAGTSLLAAPPTVGPPDRRQLYLDSPGDGLDAREITWQMGASRLSGP